MESENTSEDSYTNTTGNKSEFPMDDTKRYPEILMKNIGVACVFWMQKFFNTDMFRYNDDYISEIIARYRLEYVDPQTALLFASLLGNVSASCVFSYIAEYPDILRMPAANYIVTNILCEISDDAERETVLNDLHEMIRERYPKERAVSDRKISHTESAHDFFSHINDLTADILSVGPASRDNHVNIALTQANALRLQNKELVHSIAEFETAAGIGSLEWLIQAWNLYESSGYFEKALECFEKALDMQYNIDTLTKILYCSIVFGRYDVTKKYLDIAEKKGNSVNEYWAAYYLWQGQNQLAFEKLVSMLSAGEGIRDIPAGTIHLLSKAISFELHAKDSFDWQNDDIRVLATFLSIFLLDWKISDIFSMALRHWEYILSMVNNCTTEEMLAERIIEIVAPLIRKSDRKPEKDTVEAEAVSLLHQYAYATQVYFAGLIKDEKDTNILRNMEEYTRDLKYHIVLVLKKLPSGKNYAEGWMGDIGSVELENRFVHRASTTIQ